MRTLFTPPTKETTRDSLQKVMDGLKECLSFADTLKIDTGRVSVLVEAKEHVMKILNFINSLQLRAVYINHFSNMASTFRSLVMLPSNLNEYTPQDAKLHIESKIDPLEVLLIEEVEILKFYETIGFTLKNLVAVGANGSGKTTLSYKLKTYLPRTGVFIAAQRLLTIPKFSQVNTISIASQQLSESQRHDKNLKSEYNAQLQSPDNINAVTNEFKFLMDHLIAERNARRNAFVDGYLNGNIDEGFLESKLDKTISIWNLLFPHRILECIDSINISVRTLDSELYSANLMSDGEKAALYFICHALQAPENEFIIIDEPEMYLHNAILKKLWDILEAERSDCLFIYLTHNLDFATSRINANKFWVRSFIYPDHWDLYPIPDNEVPEPLLLELLGSRKSILFCEGDKGSKDERIYSILFPNLTIMPVGTCFNVINYTKAFNKINNLTIKSFGLIDSDHHDVIRLNSLKTQGIYHIEIAEVENLFLDEDFIKILSKRMLRPENVIITLKDKVINTLKNKKEIQISNYVSAKIDFYFKQSHVSKGNNKIEVKNNYNNLNNSIDIDKWHEERDKFLEDIITQKNYQKAITVFNDKGLRQDVEQTLKIADFIDASILLAAQEPLTHSILLKYFPDELKEV